MEWQRCASCVSDWVWLVNYFPTPSFCYGRKQVKNVRNIVIIVSPLNAIIEDQAKVLRSKGLAVAVLQCEPEVDEDNDLFRVSTQSGKVREFTVREMSGKNFFHPFNFFNLYCFHSLSDT